MPTMFGRPARLSRRQLLADNQQMRAHLFELGALAEVHQQSVQALHDDLAASAAESESVADLAALDARPAAAGPVRPSETTTVDLSLQPVLLPADARQARAELGRVLSDRARVERINDNLRKQIQDKDATIAILSARLSVVDPIPEPDMVVPWQTLSSAA